MSNRCPFSLDDSIAALLFVFVYQWPIKRGFTSLCFQMLDRYAAGGSRAVFGSK